MAVVIIKRPGQTDRQEVLPEEEVTIGRDGSNNIVIEDPRISRQHASILTEPTGHRVRDLGSRNGTRVNGKVVEVEGHLLRNGDQIALGGNQVILSYLSGDDTVTGTDTVSRWGIPLPWQMQMPGPRWRFLVWLRLVGIILGVIGSALAIIFWLTKILSD